MAYAVYLKVNTESYQKFLAIQTALNTHSSAKQAHALGAVFAEVAVQIVQQAFIELLEQQKRRIRLAHGYDIADDAEKVIAHVVNAIQKYLPWSIALLSNARLKPVVDYFDAMIVPTSEQIFLKYNVDHALVLKTNTAIEQVQNGQRAAIQDAFACLIQMIDLGVQQLIYQPKQLLKFNLVVDKTLNGVIQVCCNLAYKRLTQLGQEVGLDVAPFYIEHFLSFLDSESAFECVQLTEKNP
ncbi:hypothetical protein [Acinetobacter sp. MD2(2019)]|uniref:hypothetical protein n=1 Tax=Acinetobacter sp. MD2(2019) TaxID=2605273 RepID=UPI002D1F85A2|nr:hypothetical protein [Acinetobacter sp. MD2(2019)]MEB3753918.1 hypothetical protein [Acinetobacter sp. MD2(2019)]